MTTAHLVAIIIPFFSFCMTLVAFWAASTVRRLRRLEGQVDKLAAAVQSGFMRAAERHAEDPSDLEDLLDGLLRGDTTMRHLTPRSRAEAVLQEATNAQRQIVEQPPADPKSVYEWLKKPGV